VTHNDTGCKEAAAAGETREVGSCRGGTQQPKPEKHVDTRFTRTGTAWAKRVCKHSHDTSRTGKLSICVRKHDVDDMRGASDEEAGWMDMRGVQRQVQYVQRGSVRFGIADLTHERCGMARPQSAPQRPARTCDERKQQTETSPARRSPTRCAGLCFLQRQQLAACPQQACRQKHRRQSRGFSKTSSPVERHVATQTTVANG
jgi:hypothetical protein